MAQRHLAPSAHAAFRRFRIAVWVALLLVMLVVAAGGIVRATGAGMGCPDWPMCFGQVIPPTEASQLPADYQARFDLHGHGVDEFNAVKTWTEYVNRLIGALAGLGVLIMAGLSLPLWRISRSLVFTSFFVLVAMLVQGWLGAKVVSSNLAPYMITIHMLLALVIVMALVLLLLRVAPATWRLPHRMPAPLSSVLLFGFAVALVQLILGTQVRQLVDAAGIASDSSQDAGWAEALGWVFLVHRSFSWLVLAAHLLMAVALWRHYPTLRLMKGLAFATGLLPVVLMLIGIGLAEWGLLPALQPFHLWLGFVMVSVDGFLVLMTLRGRNLLTQQQHAVPLSPIA